MAKKSNEIVPLQVRMRRGLLEKLQADAKRQEQSLNAEIVGRLEGSYDDERDALNFQKAVAVLAGNAENAQLLAMIAIALHLVTLYSSRKKADISEEPAMEAFLKAVELITTVHAGKPVTPRAFDPQDTMSIEYEGYLLADVILRSRDLPPVLEKTNTPQWDGLWLSKLGEGMK